MSNYPLPKIVYGMTTLTFLHQPRFVPYADLVAIRHDNRASSGKRERIYESTDQFYDLTMEWVAGGADVAAWDAFFVYALQGGSFSYYPDASSGTNITVLLEDSNWRADYKSLAEYTFKFKLVVAV